MAHLEQLSGSKASHTQVRDLRFSLPIWITGMNTSGDESFCSLLGNSVKPVNPYKELLFWLMGCARHTLPAIGLGLLEQFRQPPKAEAKYKAKAESLRDEFQQLLGDDGVFIYPTHPIPAPYHNQALFHTFNFAYTGIFNILGLPCTAVPMGLSKQGVPIGFQVVGAKYSDRLTIAVAEELERAFGGWVPPFQVQK